MDGVLPANGQELSLINKNARAIIKELQLRAERRGIPKREVTRAIGEYWKWEGIERG